MNPFFFFLRKKFALFRTLAGDHWGVCVLISLLFPLQLRFTEERRREGRGEGGKGRKRDPAFRSLRNELF